MTLYLQKEPLLAQLFQFPHLPLYKREIDAFLADEQKRREGFYELITEDSRAEFINGEMIVQSPAKHQHTQIRQRLTSLLQLYVIKNQLGIVCSETALVTLTRNDYLPDVCFFGEAKAHAIEPNQMKYPAPDVVIEILSPSTERIDRGIKFTDYAAHDVGEYWLIDPQTETVEQYLLNKGEYLLHAQMGRGDQIVSQLLGRINLAVAGLFDDEAYMVAMAAMIK